jgi:hypothetical protein
MPIVIRLRLFLTQFLRVIRARGGNEWREEAVEILSVREAYLGEGESLRAKKSVCWLGWGEKMVTSLEQWF